MSNRIKGKKTQKLKVLVLVLVKCYDIKMVLLPVYLFITSLIKPEATNQQKKSAVSFLIKNETICLNGH